MDCWKMYHKERYCGNCNNIDCPFWKDPKTIKKAIQ